MIKFYKKYLGIDWGSKRIGLAIGDDETKIATPFKVVKDMNEVLQVINNENVQSIVLGKPYQISDSRFPISEQFNDFLSLLRAKTKVRIDLIDERLSSKAADALVGDKKTKASRDTVAAMLILQNYLDKLP